MKIEMGESLMQSYLKYEKGCLVTQTNWKTSSRWRIADDDNEAMQTVFEKIHAHADFSDIFGSNSLEQALKQAELDVVGINNDKLYMVEVAFHENGLQYGGRTETKDRVCKKLLRAYLIGLAYFPNFTYEILFASPKVTPATDKTIKEYFSVLEKDFGDGENVIFRYLANDDFKTEILIPTLKASELDSDTSELFLRSAKLLNLFALLNVDSAERGESPAPESNSRQQTGDFLLRDLRTVGFSTFIKYYEQYANPQCKTSDIREILFQSGEYKLNSCYTKASVGKSIVNKGQGRAALEIIANARNIDARIAEQAREWLRRV